MRGSGLTAVLIGLAAAAMLGCGDARNIPARPTGNTGARSCTPGETARCACVGATTTSGTQTCSADNTFGACDCSTIHPDAGRVERDAGLPLDGGAPHPDGGLAPKDAGPPADASGERDAFFANDADNAPDAFVPFPDAFVPSPDAFVPFPDAAVVDPDAGSVDSGTAPCTSDGQCPGSRCHPLVRQCVPAGQKGPCEPCTSSTECGLAQDACLVYSSGGVDLEQVCAQACVSSAHCPRGYQCTSGRCYPRTGSFRLHTCASLTDMLAGRSCSSASGVDGCGVPNFDDGTCFVGLESCVVGCTDSNDCPLGSTCFDYIVAKFCRP